MEDVIAFDIRDRRTSSIGNWRRGVVDHFRCEDGGVSLLSKCRMEGGDVRRVRKCGC